MPRPLPAPRRQRRLPIFAGFGLGFLLLGALAAFAFQGNRAASADRRLVAHTLQVLGQASRMETMSLLMESRHRAWLVTGTASILERRREAHAQAAHEGRALERLVADNPAQVARARRALAAIEARHEAMLVASAHADAAGLDAARAAFDPLGRDSMDALRAPLVELRAEEERLLAERTAVSDLSERRHDALLLGGGGLAAVLLLAAGWALLRQVQRAESAGRSLARLAAEQHAMLDNAGLIVIGLRPDGSIRVFNRAACEALGYTAEAAIGPLKLDRFLAPSELDAAGCAALLERVAAGTPERGEWTFVRRDGTSFPAALSIDRVRSQEGEALGFIALASDLTARRESEQAIRALNEELTVQAEDLELTNHELESFSYSVSHDLRAPLRHIAGYARILQEDAADRLDEDGRRHLDTIAASARRMGALIDDLLALSRLGRRAVQQQKVDMTGLVHDAMREAGVPEAMVEIAALPPVMGDPSLLKQVWINLLSNAMKYSTPRGDAARITVHGEAIGDHVRYCVRDNGVGFDMRYRDKLFGVFQRLHGQDEFEGTGVGLAIVHRIVSRHGGRIDAEGEPGRGAVFMFDLPIQGGAR